MHKTLYRSFVINNQTMVINNNNHRYLTEKKCGRISTHRSITKVLDGRIKRLGHVKSWWSKDRSNDPWYLSRMSVYGRASTRGNARRAREVTSREDIISQSWRKRKRTARVRFSEITLHSVVSSDTKARFWTRGSNAVSPFDKSVRVT